MPEALCVDVGQGSPTSQLRRIPASHYEAYYDLSSSVTTSRYYRRRQNIASFMGGVSYEAVCWVRLLVGRELETCRYIARSVRISSVRRVSYQERPAAPIRARPAGSFSISVRQRASVAGWFGSTTRPVRPSSTYSGSAPVRVTSTGFRK